MSERQEKLLALMERTKSLSKEAPYDLRKQIFQESGSWTKESLETPEKNKILEGMWKDRRNPKMEEKQARCFTHEWPRSIPTSAPGFEMVSEAQKSQHALLAVLGPDWCAQCRFGSRAVSVHVNIVAVESTCFTASFWSLALASAAFLELCATRFASVDGLGQETC